MGRSPSDAESDSAGAKRRGNVGRRRERPKRKSDIDADRKRSDRDQEPRPLPVNAIRPSRRRAFSTSAAREVEEVSRSHPTDWRGSTNPTDIVPEEVRRRFVKIGNKYHFHDGARAFTDHGGRLTTPSANTEVVKSLVAIAQARGWSHITVAGTDTFKREAWFAARSVGLSVRGYIPTEFEQSRLARTLAREASRNERQSSFEPARPDASGLPRAPDKGSPSDRPSGRKQSNKGRSTDRHLSGRLIDHGPAPYRHKTDQPMSYFVQVEAAQGEREIWGVDLERAMTESLSRPKPGDEIVLKNLGQKQVTVRVQERDETGRLVKDVPLDTHRNRWLVETKDFLRERAKVAAVLRDSSIDPKQGTEKHPELQGSYLQLKAAELASQEFTSVADQQRFVALVREKLADSVARGEPMKPVRLRGNERVRQGQSDLPANSRAVATPPPSERGARDRDLQLARQ